MNGEPLFVGRTLEGYEEGGGDTEALKVLEQVRVHDSAIESLLSSIDFAVVRELIDGDLRRADPELKRPARVLPRERLYIIDAKGAEAIGAPCDSVMAYMPHTDTIIINRELMHALIEAYKPQTPEFSFLRTLMHEMRHLNDAVVARGDEKKRWFQAGVMRLHISEATRYSEFQLLNESINERRAYQLALQYMSQTGGKTGLKRLGKELNFLEAPATMQTIVGAVILDEIARRVAKEKGVSQDLVASSFIHATVNGLTLSLTSTKIELDLDSVMGRGFTKALGELGSMRDNVVAFLKKSGIPLEPLLRWMHKYPELQ